MALQIKPAGCYLDVTYGRGGHSRAIAAKLGAAGRLVAMDRDPQAVAHGRAHPPAGPRFDIVQACFSELSRVRRELLAGRLADGVLADLGVSSPQLERPERGFGFHADGPLDMRMDPGSGISAADWLARAEQQELKRVIRAYGEEKYAARIARAIVERRAAAPLGTTRELAALVAEQIPDREHEPGRHPATRTFQAIRMHINEELDQLEALLPQAVESLAADGRLAVISFHSLEDRIVKRFIRDEARGDPYPSDLPVTAGELKPKLRTVGKPIRAACSERQSNRRARSAILRVAERTGVACA